jgi:ATP-binding cassette subfamily F protein uup
MAEIELSRVTVSFGGAPLLDAVDLSVERGERIGLLGRNGAGKSTLLRVLLGALVPDEGRILRRPGLVVGALSQDVPRGAAGSVHELVRGGLPDGEPAWSAERAVERELTRFGLRGEARVESLSAGSVRRALLARALVPGPDLLVLDEPTNHLDVDAIAALEELLAARAGTLVFVTHDRAFLQNLATRIVDLDRGRLSSWSCDYVTYLERKEAALASEAKTNAEFDKKLAQEEVWIRRGVEARRTRNMGRVRALVAMREERRARRERVGGPKAALHGAAKGLAERSGQLVVRTTGLGFAYGTGAARRAIVEGLDLEVGRGDRIGIVGPNGCGKSTLVRLLLGELAPQAGSVRLGTNLEIGRFDQLHGLLDESRTVMENVCGKADTVTIGGRTRHAISYLGDFLFTPEQARGPIGRLSGGERNRVQLAKLLARPANLLVLDEPTNDLDVETLELLEQILLEFEGTLLLVSHDRAFLDNVVTSILVHEGEGRWNEYVGGYGDWKAKRDAASAEAAAIAREAEARERAKQKGAARANPSGAAAASAKPRKLTFTRAHELERLPARIEAAAAERTRLEAVLGEPNFWREPAAVQAQARAAFERATLELAQLEERWLELESLAEG